jgi:hypothetical protein
MNEPLYQEVDQALAELTRSRQALATLVQATRDRTVTATSRRRVLAVTVGLRGELRDIVFRGESYRTLPPRELAQLIIDTVEAARSKSLAQATAVIGELLPTTTPVWAGGEGEPDFDGLVAGMLDRMGGGLDDTERREVERAWEGGS